MVSQCLFTDYGIAQSKEVKQEETDIHTMTIHLVDPMVITHGAVEKLPKIAISAGADKFHCPKIFQNQHSTP